MGGVRADHNGGAPTFEGGAISVEVTNQSDSELSYLWFNGDESLGTSDSSLEVIGPGAYKVEVTASLTNMVDNVELVQTVTSTSAIVTICGVTFKVSPEEAVVTVDGATVEAGEQILMKPGTYKYTVTASGYVSKTEEFIISEGNEQNIIEVVLDPEPDKTVTAGETVKVEGDSVRVVSVTGIVGGTVTFQFGIGTLELTGDFTAGEIYEIGLEEVDVGDVPEGFDYGFNVSTPIGGIDSIKLTWIAAGQDGYVVTGADVDYSDNLESEPEVESVATCNDGVLEFVTYHNTYYWVKENLEPVSEPGPDNPPYPWWDDDDEYIPLVVPVQPEESGDDDTTTIVACAAAAVVAALMAAFLIMEYRRN